MFNGPIVEEAIELVLVGPFRRISKDSHIQNSKLVLLLSIGPTVDFIQYSSTFKEFSKQ